ncbi:MFS transporter [Halorarius litoreus]|uniref:MFS transporter n=1 Tax=Halorarius litoreus TaxID=2962676 RepID=UPI0020CD5D55|nr:MFS transporter [Halorarius litoreus]
MNASEQRADAPTPERERLFTGYQGRLSLSLAVGWLALQLGRQTIPPLLPRISADLSLSPLAVGTALTLMWAAYAMVHYPSGRLADALSRKTVVVAALVVSAAGFAALSLSTSYLTLAAGMVLAGVGSGLYFVAARALLSDTFTSRRSQAFGLHSGAGNIGSTLAAGVTLLVVTVAVWQVAFLPVVLLLLAVVVVLHVVLREPYVVNRVDFQLRATGTRLRANTEAAQVALVFGLFSFVVQGMLNFLPSFLQVERGFSEGLASGGFAAMFVVAIVVMPLAGRFGDRIARVPVAAGALTVAVVGFLAIVLAPTPSLIVASILLFSVGIWAFPPVMQVHLMGQFPAANMEGDFGAMRTLYIAFGSLGPTYVGFLAEQLSYTAAFAGLILVLAVAAALTARLARR